MKKVMVHCSFFLFFSLVQFAFTSKKPLEDELYSPESRGNISQNAKIQSGFPQNEQLTTRSITNYGQKNVKESLTQFHEQISTLRNHIRDLDTQVSSEFNHHSLLKSIIEADRNINELKIFNLQNLPHLTMTKVEKLMQSVENIKTNLFVLIQNHQFQSVPTIGNKTYLNILKRLVESLYTDLQVIDSKNSNSVERLKLLTSTKIHKIAILREKIGQYNIPKYLQINIEKVKKKYNKIMNLYRVDLDRFWIFNNKKMSNQEIRHHLKLIYGWVIALENDLNYYENHYDETQIAWIDFKISTQLDRITHEVEEIGGQNLSEELKIRVKALQDRVRKFKIEVILKHGHHSRTTSEIGEIELESKEQIKHFRMIVATYENDFRKILKEISFQLNSSNLSVAVSKVHHILFNLRLTQIENLPEKLVEKLKILQKLLERFKAEAESITIKSQEYVYNHIAKLYHDFEVYQKLAQYKYDLTTLIQLQINSSKILYVLKELGPLDVYKKTLQNKVKILKDNVKYFQENLIMKIREKQTQENDEKDIVESVTVMRKKVDFLNHILHSINDIKILTYCSILCDEILSSLQELERDEIFSETLKDVKKSFSNYLNHLKKNIILMIQTQVENNNQNKDNIELEINNNIKNVKLRVESLEKELLYLLQLIKSKQDLLELYNMYNQAEMILIELKQLEQIKSLPSNLRLKIVILKDNTSKFKKQVKLRLQDDYKLENRSLNSQNVEEYKIKVIIKKIIALEDNLELIENQTHSKQDILTLTQANMESDKILYILNQLQRENWIPDILKYKISKLIQKVKHFIITLKLLFESETQRITEVLSTAFTKNESQSNIYKSVIALRDELYRLKTQADSNQDVLTKAQLSRNIDEVLQELHQLANTDNSSSVFKVFEILKINITDFQNYIDSNFNPILLDTTKEPNNKKWQILNETITNLENNFENIIKTVKFNNDILTLTQSSLQLDELIFALQKLQNENDLPEIFRQKIIVLEQRKINFRMKVQELLHKNILYQTIGQDNFFNKMEYTKFIQNIEDSVGSIQRSLDDLKNSVTSKNDLLSLTQTNIKTQELLHDLEELNKIQSLPVILKNRILVLQGTCTDFKKSLILLIERISEQEIREKKVKEFNHERYNKIDKNITNLESDLKYLKEITNTNQDIFTLIKTVIETNNILDHVQTLKIEDVLPIVLQIKLVMLEEECNNFKLHLHLTLERTLEILKGNSSTNIFSTFQNIEDIIQNLNISLQNLKSVIILNQDILTLTQADNEANNILDVLRNLKRIGHYFITLQTKIKTFEENVYEFKDKLKSLIDGMTQNPNKDQTNEMRDLSKEKKLKVVYELLISLEQGFENLKKGNLNEDLLIISQTNTAVDDILYNLQHIDIDDSIPYWLKNRIVALVQNLNSFKSYLSMKFVKSVQRLVNSSNNEKNMKHMLNTIDVLKNSFEHLKNLTNYKRDLVTLIHVNNKVEEILQELREIKQILPVELKPTFSTLEQNVNDFKSYIDSLLEFSIHHMNSKPFNHSSIDALQMVEKNITYAESIVLHLRNLINSKPDFLTLTNANIELDGVLKYLYHLKNVKSFPERLKNKIFTLGTTAEILKSLIDLKIESITDELSKSTPKESDNIVLHNIEKSINLLEMVLEQLNNLMNSTQELMPLQLAYNQAETLLQELLRLNKVNTFPDIVENRIEDVKKRVIMFKNKIIVSIANIISNKNVKENIKEDDDNSEEIMDDINLKQSLSTLTYVNINTKKILHKLQVLNNEGRVSKDLKNEIIQLLKNIKVVKKTFKNLFGYAIDNFMVDLYNPSDEFHEIENMKNIEEILPSLETYLNTLRNLVEFKQYLLTLTHPNVEGEEISQELNKEEISNLLFDQDKDIFHMRGPKDYSRKEPKLLFQNPNIVEYQDEIQRNLKQISDNLFYLEQFVENQKLLLNSNDIQLLAEPYLRTDDVLEYLQGLQRENNLPYIMKEKIFFIKQDTEEFKIHVRQNLERIIQSIASSNKHQLGTQESLARVEGIVDFLKTILDHLENKADTKQDHSTLIQTINQLNDILITLEYLVNIEGIPLILKNKIRIIEENAKNFEKQINNFLRFKPTPGRPVDESVINQPVNRLEEPITWLQDFVNHSQNPEVDNLLYDLSV